MKTAMKVGTLAKRTGITVRTLHHYDEIGLLSPGGRTSAGHRLYGDAEVQRLQQVASLRHLGFSLEQIRDCLDGPEYSLDRVLELQVERIDEAISQQKALRDLICTLRDRLQSVEGASVDDLTRTIEVTMNHEKYYTPAQLEQLRRRGDEVGEERIQQVQREWAELFAAYGNAMNDGVDPASDQVQELARKSASLIGEFTDGDPGISASLSNMYRGEGGEKVVAEHGMQTPPGLWEYMARASAALKEGPSA